MWKRIYRINWDGGLECKGKGWVPEGQMQRASQTPAKAPYVGRDMCIWGEGYVNPLFTQGLQVNGQEGSGENIV